MSQETPSTSTVLDICVSEHLFVEEPRLKHFARKLTIANSVSATLVRARQRAIEKHQATYAKACRLLRIPEMRAFVRQIGERQIDMSRNGLQWRHLNAIISVLVVSGVITSPLLSVTSLYDIVSLLQNDTYTTSVDLSDNNLDISCVSYLAKLLSKNSHISQLVSARTEQNAVLINNALSLAGSVRKQVLCEWVEQACRRRVCQQAPAEVVASRCATSPFSSFRCTYTM